MTITAKEWARYRDRLSAINKKAAELMQQYVLEHGYEVNQALIDYAYSLATKYGEAAAELACIMHDDMTKYYSLSNSEKMAFEPAIPAETATYGETAAAVTAAGKQYPTSIPNVVGRLVKQAGADTTLKNALRDGAEFAWIPHGDTCSFCLMLASNGWQKASKKTIKGDHAEHIHANCDCTFAIRFDGKSNVEGFDPDKYREMYDNADGNTWQEKLNSMRRDNYANNADEIRAQKREAYARYRKIHYGELNDFQTDRGTVVARRVDKYGYNNIYVDEKVDLTERQLRKVNNQISEAKRVVGVLENCDANVLVADMDDPIASYNPRTNTMLISSRMVSKEEILKAQEIFTCPDDDRSTAVHEIFHWRDAFEYRKEYGEITDASITSPYSVYQREKAITRLREVGINIDDLDKIKEISEYALNSALANGWEEVYTEYRTKVALTGGV